MSDRAAYLIALAIFTIVFVSYGWRSGAGMLVAVIVGLVVLILLLLARAMAY